MAQMGDHLTRRGVISKVVFKTIQRKTVTRLHFPPSTWHRLKPTFIKCLGKWTVSPADSTGLHFLKVTLETLAKALRI